MPYNNPGNEDLYSDGDASQESQGEATPEKDAPTALLPKSILMGKKFNVGDEVVLKITGMHGDEISVAYAPEPSGEEGYGEGEPAGSPEMEEMMQ